MSENSSHPPPNPGNGLNSVQPSRTVDKNKALFSHTFDPDSNIAGLELRGMIDLLALQNMAEANYKANGMPIGIVDARNGEIYVGVGWQDICTKFHRVHPVSKKRCLQSDTQLADKLSEGEVAEYKCTNGLWDIGIPIFVSKEHVANIFLGQFFYEHEHPDRDFFLRQARDLDFDITSYMAALDNVPKFPRKQVELIIDYNKSLASFIATLAEGNIAACYELQERRKTEEILLLREEEYRLLVENQADLVVKVDRSGTFEFVSPSYCQLFGLRKEELLGQSFMPLIHEDDQEETRQAMRKLYEPPYRTFVQQRAMTVSGWRWLEWVDTSILDSQGNVQSIIGVGRDITERKQAEKEREALQNQLLQSQKMESIGRLAGGVAHDLNNMLVAILGYGDLLLADDTLHQKQKKRIELMHQAGQKSRDLVSQLLAFSRNQEQKLQNLDINDLVRDFERLFQKTIREDISRDYHLTPDLPLVYADRSQLEQVILNLAVNGQDAMPNGGSLCIETSSVHLDEHYAAEHVHVASGDYVLVSVSDSGHGMNTETQEHIFEPFFTTKSLEEGTGLGLSTAYGIVKQHQGNICVYSEPGQGTTFKIYLPVSQDLNEDMPESCSQETLQTKGHETVMIVEDKGMVRELAAQVLEEQGYHVLSAASGKKCMQMLKSSCEPVHLLLADVIMPDMNGKALYEQIVSWFPKLKVLFMSGYTQNVISKHGVLDKDVAFLQKPFSIHDLCAAVRRVLDGGV